MKKRLLAGFLSVCMMAGLIAYPADVSVVRAEATERAEGTSEAGEIPEANKKEPELPDLEEQELVSVGNSEVYTYEDYAYIVLDDDTIELWRYSGSDSDISIPDTIDGKVVTSIGKSAFGNCMRLTSITIPASVTSIGESAFSGCRSLTSITIPASVTSIGKSAFGYCSSLTSITIPDSVASIGEYAFVACSSLTSITIPASVTSIGDYAFDNCRSLTSITIPASVMSIGYEAFSWCTSLTIINVSEGNANYSSKDGILYNKEMTELIRCPGGIEGNFNIPEGVTSIGDYAFGNCMSLTSITIPASVTSIGEKAFSDCTSLTSITIPASVTSIGDYAFFWSTSLTIINVSEGNVNYSSKDGILYNKKMTELICCPEGIDRNFNFPEGVTSIGEGAFFDCMNLTSITIPASVTSIGEGAFTYCGNLTSITIPASVTSIGEKAFNGCENLAIYCYKDSAAHTYAIKHEFPYKLLDNTIEETHTHQYISKVTKATTSKNGSITKKCSVCGNVASKTTIYYPKTITLSKTSYTYNGKAQKPTVTVKDSKGKKLKKGTDYTVTYSKGCKSVGKYTVTIKFKGNYSGTVKKTFTITPKSTSLTKLTAKKKGFTAKWKKLTSQTTGYQIQYSTSSKFTKKTTKTAAISKNKTTSKTISKLKAKKKYYVRIRTYKTVKVNGKSTKIYSGWSKTKAVTTKK